MEPAETTSPERTTPTEEIDQKLKFCAITFNSWATFAVPPDKRMTMLEKIQVRDELLSLGPILAPHLYQLFQQENGGLYFDSYLTALGNIGHIPDIEKLIIEPIQEHLIGKDPLPSLTDLAADLLIKTAYESTGRERQILINQLTAIGLEMARKIPSRNFLRLDRIIYGLAMLEKQGKEKPAEGPATKFLNLKPIKKAIPEKQRHVYLDDTRLPFWQQLQENRSLSTRQQVIEQWKRDDFETSFEAAQVETPGPLSRQINQFTENKYPPATRLAINLFLFNHNCKHPKATETEWQRLIDRKLQPIIDRESAYLDPQNLLPTLGLEIEIPLELKPNVRPEKIFEMASLGLDGYIDLDTVFEFRFPPSASPQIQGLIAHLLAESGAIPMFKTNNGFANIDGVPLPLHLNFNLPTKILDLATQSPVEFNRVEMEASLLATTLAIAYASPSRVRQATFRRHVVFSKRPRGDLIKATKDDGELQENRKISRIEIRCLDFHSGRVNRALIAGQQLTAMFYEAVKSRADQEHNLPQARQWHRFVHRAEIALEQAGLSHQDLSSAPGPDLIAYLMERGVLRRQLRRLVKEAIAPTANENEYPQ